MPLALLLFFLLVVSVVVVVFLSLLVDFCGLSISVSPSLPRFCGQGAAFSGDKGPQSKRSSRQECEEFRI